MGTGHWWRAFALAFGCVAASGCDVEPDPAPRGGELDEKQEKQETLEPEPLETPPVCLTAKECEENEYCLVPDGECGREGVCTPMPLECSRERELVCSCDGVDFKNPCLAAQAKQTVDLYGRCPPPPCQSNAQCGANAYCAKAAGDCKGLGVCEPKPTSCSGLWNPVCGCNNLTYANGCKAAAVGVGVGHLGTCG